MQAEYLQHVLESYLTPQAHEQAENYRVMLFEKVMDTVGDGADHHRPGRGGSQDGTEHRGMAPEDVQVRLHLARKPYKVTYLGCSYLARFYSLEWSKARTIVRTPLKIFSMNYHP